MLHRLIFTMPKSNKISEFVQINLHKATAPSAELNMLLNKKTSFIALIQEPMYRNMKIQGLNRRKGNVIHALGMGRPRACIYISKDWTVHPLYHLCTNDLVAAKLKAKKCGNDIEIIICSAYLPYDSKDIPPTEEFINLVNYCKTNNMTVLFGIDANAHHHSWGSKDMNVRGKSFLEYIISSHLIINNVGCKPTFVNKNRSEVLDVTLSSSELYPFITEWKVTELIHTSDHKCITFDLNLDTSPPILFRNPASTNWSIFLHQLGTKLSQNMYN